VRRGWMTPRTRLWAMASRSAMPTGTPTRGFQNRAGRDRGMRARVRMAQPISRPKVCKHGQQGSGERRGGGREDSVRAREGTGKGGGQEPPKIAHAA
jgi:hypothetical protein